MLLNIITGFISLAIILVSCEFFTNAVEWTGKKFKLNEGMTGSILAAVGTALPETIVPIIAILFIPGKAGEDIGIGAILGAPLMLSTLAYGITGIAVIYFHFAKKRPYDLKINSKILSNDMAFFMGVYILALLFAFLPQPLKKPLSFLFLAIYAFYVYRTMKHEGSGSEEDLRPLFFSRAKDPSLTLVLLQDLVSVAGIVLGARFFVTSIEHISTAMNVSPFIFALFVAPIATELPEKFNSVIWVGKKKDTLALGNISGAMVFQSSIVVFVGAFGTPWILNTQAKLSAVVAILSAGVIMLYLKLFKKLNAFVLLSGLFFYLLYIALIIMKVK